MECSVHLCSRPCKYVSVQQLSSCIWVTLIIFYWISFIYIDHDVVIGDQKAYYSIPIHKYDNLSYPPYNVQYLSGLRRSAYIGNVDTAQWSVNQPKYNDDNRDTF